MTTNPQANQEHVEEVQKSNDKELNFRKQQAMYEKMLEEKEKALRVAEKQIQEISARNQPVNDDDDDDDEPYVDKKKLKKQLNKFSQQTIQETDSRIQSAVQRALSEERKNLWLEQNSDFYDVMQHAEKFAEKAPGLAKTILNMPEGFERQKLVYENIKTMGIHKKEEPMPSIQETVDRNRRNPGYQPSGIGSAPYGATTGGKDYSPGEMKSAHDKMKELQKKLRI